MVGRRPIRLAKAGTPDVLAMFITNQIAWVYWIECKKFGGKLTEIQKDFKMDFTHATNVICEVVFNPDQVDDTIEACTGYTNNSLENIDIFGKEGK